MKLIGKIALFSTLVIIVSLLLVRFYPRDKGALTFATTTNTESELAILGATLARYSGCSRFETDGMDDVFSPSLTVEIQDMISKTLERLYWIETYTDSFDIFRTEHGAVLWLMTSSDNEVNLVVSDPQLTGILARQPSNHRGAKYLLIFSLTSASPLRLHLQPTSLQDNRYDGTLREFVVLNEGEIRSR